MFNSIPSRAAARITIMRTCIVVASLFLLAAVVHADRLHVIHEDSLTTYLPSNPSAVHDVRPRATQRATPLSGGSGFLDRPDLGGDPPPLPQPNPGDLEQRPFGPDPDPGPEPCPDGGIGDGGMYIDKVPLATTVDVSLSSPGFRWFIGRSNNPMQIDNGQHHVSNGYQGRNWFQSSQPEIVLFEHSTDAAKDMIYLIVGAASYMEFRRVDDLSDTFRGVNGTMGAIRLLPSIENDPSLYAYTSINGVEMTFFGFDQNAGAAAGQLWKTSFGGHTAYVGHQTNALDAISQGYDNSGRITTAYDTAGRRYDYDYNGSGYLERVDVLVHDGVDWEPTGNEVEYEYYGPAEAYGSEGDLKIVRVTVPLSEQGIVQTRKTYYRYWKGAFNATTNPGHPHAVQYVFESEGLRRFDWSNQQFDESFLTASESPLKPYASAYFEYDAERRVNLTWSGGDCGCSGAADGVFELTYETNSSHPANAGYDPDWLTRVIIAGPGGSYVVQYFDEVGQQLSHVLAEGDPADTPSPAMWATKIVRDGDGLVSHIHSTANVTAYDHANATFTTSETEGLVEVFDRISNTNDPLYGFLRHKKWQRGTLGDEYLEHSIEYTTLSRTVGDLTLRRPLTSARWVYSQQTTTEASGGSGPAGAHETTFDYLAYSGDDSLRIKQVTATHPAVSVSNNGSGASAVTKRYLRRDGTTAFSESADGIFTYTAYENGQVVLQIQDARTNETYPAGDEPNADFGIVETGDGWHRSTEHIYDARGRLQLTIRPNGRQLKRHYSRLADDRLATLQYPDFEAGGTPKYFGPVQYVITNHARQTEVQAVVAVSGGETTTAITSHIDEQESDPITAVAQLGSLSRLATSVYNQMGRRLDESRTYFDIPVSGEGTAGTNYDATSFAYDDAGRRVRVEEPHGTIRINVYDAIGRLTEQWIGTDDGHSGDMEKTLTIAYDSDSPNQVASQTEINDTFVLSMSTTAYEYDVRGRAVLVTNPTSPHTFNKYDNMGRRLASAQYSSVSGIDIDAHDPVTRETNRLSLSQTFYDERERPWKTQRHKIDPSTGSDQDHLASRNWYDAAGRLVKVQGEQLAKMSYDRLGRQTHRFILARTDDTGYGNALSVTGDIVLEEHQTVYESSDSDEAVLRAVIARFHDDYGSGETTGALDSNADDDPLKYTATDIKGRIQITGSWFDRFSRVTDTVAFGTYGGNTFNRSGMSVPARSDDALVTSYVYDDTGALLEMRDPKGTDTRYEYDDAGRKVKVTSNYDGGHSPPADANQVVEYVFENGLKTRMIARMPGSLDDQETIYTYGTVKGNDPGESMIATGHLLSRVEYPDSTGPGDDATFAYDVQGRPSWMKDQAGNITESTYDDAGRLMHRSVATLASGFDGAVRRISTTYDDLGRASRVTQFDNAAFGQGSVVNEVMYTYDGWSQLTSFRQDRNSAVDATGSVDDYEVTYTYVKSVPSHGRHTLRRSNMGLPDGNSVGFRYGSVGGMHDDVLSRVTSLSMSSVTFVTYRYNGAGHLVGTTYPEPNAMSNLHGSISGYYPRLDRFNRVTGSRWSRDHGSGTVNFYDVDITYDRNSNIVRTIDHVHSGFDVDYTIDDLNRLIDAEEGTWSGGQITSRSRQQTWTLDHAGNWTNAKLDLTGDGQYGGAGEYDDDRTHNVANELVERDIASGPTFTLGYDPVGNLVDDGESYKYEYDAFGRLRFIRNQNDDLVAEYVYNALGYRIGAHYDANADGDVDGDDPWYWFAYDERWRIIATFRADDEDPKERFVYDNAGLGGYGGSSYIDSVVLRDRDANTDWTAQSDGVLEERRYYCQNWRHDVVAIITDAGHQVEQIRYSAYGIPFGLPAGDMNSNGEVTAADVQAISDIVIQGSSYDVRADLNLDGSIDSTDVTLAQNMQGTTLGWKKLSAAGNRKGYAGYEACFTRDTLWHVRHRALDSELGRWTRRDPLGYVDGVSLSEYTRSNPMVYVDFSGLCSGSCSTFQVLRCSFVTSCPTGILKGSCKRGLQDWFDNVVKRLFRCASEGSSGRRCYCAMTPGGPCVTETQTTTIHAFGCTFTVTASVRKCDGTCKEDCPFIYD